MLDFGFEEIAKGCSLDDFDLSYTADYKIYVKSKDEADIDTAKSIVNGFNESI